MERDDLRMMKTPVDWPLWPILPVKRRRDLGGPECAVMVAVKEHLTTVFLVNIGQLRSGPVMPQLDAAESCEYRDYEAIVDDGWVVD